MTNEEAIRQLEYLNGYEILDYKELSTPNRREAIDLAIKALELVNDSQDLVNDLVNERPIESRNFNSTAKHSWVYNKIKEADNE